MHYPIPLHRASGDCDQHQESVWVSLWVQDTRTNQSGKGAYVHERAIVAHHTSTRCAHNQGSDATLYPSEAHECMASVRKHVQSMIFVAPFKGSVYRSRARGCGAYSQLIETRGVGIALGQLLLTTTRPRKRKSTQTHCIVQSPEKQSLACASPLFEIQAVDTCTRTYNSLGDSLKT